MVLKLTTFSPRILIIWSTWIISNSSLLTVNRFQNSTSECVILTYFLVAYIDTGCIKHVTVAFCSCWPNSPPTLFFANQHNVFVLCLYRPNLFLEKCNFLLRFEECSKYQSQEKVHKTNVLATINQKFQYSQLKSILSME